MIGFLSFLLSIFVYALVILLFLNIFPHSKKEKEVLIHTAIVIPSKYKSIKQEISKKTNKTPYVEKKIEKIEKKVKKGSKTSITKGGDVNFNDIFKNVKEDINSTPLKLQKQLEMSRFKGIEREVEKNLKKVKNINVDIKVQTSSSTNLNEKKLNEIIQKIGTIWYDFLTLPGDYAKINVISKDGKIYVTILDSNLDEDKQQELINEIKSLTFDKNFNINILFKTKVSK